MVGVSRGYQLRAVTEIDGAARTNAPTHGDADRAELHDN